MKPVIVACTDGKEAQKISESIAKNRKVAIIESSNRLGILLNVAAMVILDHSFYEQYGLKFFRSLLENPHPPFLMLTPPDDIQTIVDIVEIGMHPIPKVPDYQKLLRLNANNILDQSNEQEQLQQSVLSLKQRVEELEKAASEETNRLKRKASSDAKPHDVKSSVLDEIVFVFKRGEIELPTLPQMGIKFQEMMNKGANLQNIGKFLKQDVAISSKLISVSNSTYYRGVTESKDLGQAISRLGLKNTKRYVDTICNRSLYGTKNKRFLTFLESLWEHSLACAYAAQVLDEHLALDLDSDAFTMGLLHDIGKLLLLQVLGDLQLKKKIGDKVENSELLETVTTHHAKFGAALLKKWNFSETFSMIASYHNNLQAATSISNELLVVHFGNLMVKSMGFALDDMEDARQQEIDLEDTESARRLGLDALMIDEFKNKVSGFMEELKGLFM
jgi:putative nucleotidyltransferase with HDIG domain